MSVFHQMGHHSENLVFDDVLDTFAGVILSPVNADQEKMKKFGDAAREARKKLVFDPQLYFPKAEASIDWPYYPSDLETADLSSLDWWSRVSAQIAEDTAPLNLDGICTPTAVGMMDDEYFDHFSEVGADFRERYGKGLRVFQTVIVKMAELAKKDRSAEIASIITKHEPQAVFLAFYPEISEPRKEFRDIDQLAGSMKLIRFLTQSGIKVCVGFSSSDMCLWKHAGAQSVATGKFFNLRRFTSTRFDPPSGGGGQLPYWFDEGLMSFLREGDFLRLHSAGLLSGNSVGSPLFETVLKKAKAGKPWLAESWRHYLWWFGDLESRLRKERAKADEVLQNAEEAWAEVRKRKIFMEEAHNDGGWVARWRLAIKESEAL